MLSNESCEKDYLDRIPEGWEELWEQEMKKEYFIEMIKWLKKEYIDPDRLHQEIYPPQDKVFRLFYLCKPQDIKAVIIGQDPYHEKDQADGIAFSFNGKGKVPPSLKNIFKELGYPKEYAHATDLTNWVEKGVFLMNSILTVKEGKALSHQNKGWETFTNAVIKYVSTKRMALTFLLWGKYSHEKAKNIDEGRAHLLYYTSHPSPLSARKWSGGYRPFLGSKCFDVLKMNTGIDLKTFDEI